MTEANRSLRRRSVLKTVGALGAVGSITGIASARGRDEVQRQLRDLRRGASKYHDLENAEADGCVLGEDHCVEHPELGGMGFHAANFGLIDDQLDPSEPEILAYESTEDGYDLVAVEFVSTAPRDGDPPELFDQEFHEFPNPEAPFNWALHVWAWKNNPNGMFHDFNPRVSCPEHEE